MGINFSGPPFIPEFDSSVYQILSGLLTNLSTLDSLVRPSSINAHIRSIDISPFNSSFSIKYIYTTSTSSGTVKLVGSTGFTTESFTTSTELCGVGQVNNEGIAGGYASRITTSTLISPPFLTMDGGTFAPIPIRIETTISVGPDLGGYHADISTTIKAYNQGTDTLLASLTEVTSAFDFSGLYVGTGKTFSYNFWNVLTPDFGNLVLQVTSLSIITPSVVTPVINPDGGSFTDITTVSISSTTPGASIYYTTDGTTPSRSSTLYTAPFTIDHNLTVKAFAVFSDYNDSSVTSAAFIVSIPPPPPPIPPTPIIRNTLTGKGLRDFKLGGVAGENTPFTGDPSGTPHDLCNEYFELMLIDGVDQVRQKIKIRLQFFLGEWYLDTTVGTRYYEDVLVKNPPLSKLQSLFKAVIAETPGVTALTAFDLIFDAKNRSASITFTAQTLYGTLTTQEIL